MLKILNHGSWTTWCSQNIIDQTLYMSNYFKVLFNWFFRFFKRSAFMSFPSFEKHTNHEIAVIDFHDDGLKAFLSLFHFWFPNFSTQVSFFQWRQMSLTVRWILFPILLPAVVWTQVTPRICSHDCRLMSSLKNNLN